MPPDNPSPGAVRAAEEIGAYLKRSDYPYMAKTTQRTMSSLIDRLAVAPAVEEAIRRGRLLNEHEEKFTLVADNHTAKASNFGPYKCHIREGGSIVATVRGDSSSAAEGLAGLMAHGFNTRGRLYRAECERDAEKARADALARIIQGLIAAPSGHDSGAILLRVLPEELAAARAALKAHGGRG